jgi:predicted transcriptional regulator
MPGRPWTAEELEVLHWMRSSDDSNELIAQAINRSVESVHHQIRKEIRNGTLERREGRLPGNLPWTDADKMRLADLHATGLTAAEKAAVLKRSPGSVLWMIRRGLAEGWLQKCGIFWTDAATAELIHLREVEKLEAREIAVRMDRSLRSVWERIRYCIRHGLIQARTDEAHIARRVGVPVEKLNDYRIFRRKAFSPAEAQALCQAAR